MNAQVGCVGGIIGGAGRDPGRVDSPYPADTRLPAMRHPDGNRETRSTTLASQDRKGSAVAILPCQRARRTPGVASVTASRQAMAGDR